jgi:hypothetical protein
VSDFREPPSTPSIGRISKLDASTRARVQAGCNYVNAEVARLRKRVTTTAIACVGGAIVVWIVMGGGDPRLPFGLALAIWFLVYNNAQKQLKSGYKGIVVRRIVASLGRGLAYKPTSSLTVQHFTSMDLFNESASTWNSEDEVSGRKNNVTYALHEVRAGRRDNSSRARLGLTSSLVLFAALKATKQDQRIFFRGLIVKLDFNKNFAGHTVVIPDTEGQILGGLFGESESRRKKSIVRMENVDFEKMFSVYSTDDQEARYLITPKLMELVMEAQGLLGAQLRLCFKENSLFVTVPQDKDRFEVNMFGGAVTLETAVGDLVEVVNLAEKLVDALDLETRIWTRV